MSFQGLISGSECATTSNPLSQVLKQTESDRSLQQDRVSGPSSSRLHQLPGTSAVVPANQQDLALARQFFETNNPGHGFSMPHPAELAHMNELQAHSGPPDVWAYEHRQRFEESARTGWAAEFGNASQMNASVSAAQQNPPGMHDFQQRTSYIPPLATFASSAPMGMYGINPQMQYGMNSAFSTTNIKGKSREVDFEAAFAEITQSLGPTETQTSKIEEVNDTTHIEEALKNTSLKSKEDGEEGTADFQTVWNQLQDSDLPPPQEDMAKWEAEFSQMMNTQRNELEDYGTNMQSAWEGGVGNYDGGLKPMKFTNEGTPVLGDYIFEENNKYMDPSSSRSLLDDAKALLSQNGSLSEAALMLEAAIQKGELGEGGYESWILLGETRNMDEREEAGMRALAHGVQKAEENGTPGPGMLSLAISYTNESYDRGSHATLLRWFRATYPSVPVPQETINAMSTNSSWDTHNRVTELFLDLARTQHGQDQMDPDLQIALGVLFYTNGEYERAQDCFVAALNVRPKDYLLWNRLGSSLSNGNKPEDALGAYREALQLRPTYTRAIYNVGVACLNIGADKEAAEHFLSALALQESTNGHTSDQLWSTLRRALVQMKRNDLSDLAKLDKKPNLDVFRQQGFDF